MEFFANIFNINLNFDLLLQIIKSFFQQGFLVDSNTDSNFDKIIAISQLVTAIMGIAVAIITLIFTLIVAVGFLEYGRWRKLIEEAQKSVKLAEESAKKAEEAAENAKKIEDDLNKIRKSAEDEINKIRSQISLQFIPEVSGEESNRDIIPKEIKEKLEDLARKIELYEALGFQLRVSLSIDKHST